MVLGDIEIEFANAKAERKYKRQSRRYWRKLIKNTRKSTGNCILNDYHSTRFAFIGNNKNKGVGHSIEI